MMSGEALRLMQELVQALGSPSSKERERKCLALAGSLLQVSLAPKWETRRHPTSGRPLPPGKWQAQFAATKASLAAKLADEIFEESNSSKLCKRLFYLLERTGIPPKEHRLLASRLAISLLMAQRTGDPLSDRVENRPARRRSAKQSTLDFTRRTDK
jgi:hypothetical protein